MTPYDAPIRPGKISVEVTETKTCDFCIELGRIVTAEFDARIPVYGTWAYVCHAHARTLKIALGTGYGQRLIYPQPGVAPATR